MFLVENVYFLLNVRWPGFVFACALLLILYSPEVPHVLGGGVLCPSGGTFPEDLAERPALFRNFATLFIKAKLCSM